MFDLSMVGQRPIWVYPGVLDSSDLVAPQSQPAAEPCHLCHLLHPCGSVGTSSKPFPPALCCVSAAPWSRNSGQVSSWPQPCATGEDRAWQEHWESFLLSCAGSFGSWEGQGRTDSQSLVGRIILEEPGASSVQKAL